MARNTWSTDDLENNFGAFLKVIDYEVTLKSSSLYTGYILARGAKWDRNFWWGNNSYNIGKGHLKGWYFLYKLIFLYLVSSLPFLFREWWSRNMNLICIENVYLTKQSK